MALNVKTGVGDRMVHEYRSHRFRSADGSRALVRISKMRQALPWRRSPAKLFLLGPVSGDGVRSVDLPRESPRHRGVSAFHDQQTLSHRRSEEHTSELQS